jgi:hypothetical protein
VDGKLSDREHAAVQIHLQRCPHCTDEIAVVRRLCEILDRGVPETPTQSLEEATVRRIRTAGEPEAEAARAAAWGFRWLLPWAAGLAAVGLAVYLGGGRGIPTGARDQAERRKREMASAPPHISSAPSPAAANAGPAENTRRALAAARRTDPGEAGAESPGVEGEARTAAIDEPPGELRDTLDLFVDFPVIDELDKLEYYDSIRAVRDERAGRPRGG